MELKFPEILSFVGRNGRFKMGGVKVEKNEDIIYLWPITSRGRIGRAELQIPVSELKAFIAALQEVANV